MVDAALFVELAVDAALELAEVELDEVAAAEDADVLAALAELEVLAALAELAGLAALDDALPEPDPPRPMTAAMTPMSTTATTAMMMPTIFPFGPLGGWLSAGCALNDESYVP